MIELEALRWSPRWVSHMGCIQGCLKYLDIQVSDAWLYGATGHAFVLNINGNLCPSGPTDWDSKDFFRLGKNLGYTAKGVFGWKGDHDLDEMQEKAGAYVRSALDSGLPCYGWELDVPEFYVIFGYDDDGYYVSGPHCEEGKGPVSWRELGITPAFGLAYNTAVWAECRRNAWHFLQEAQKRLADDKADSLFHETIAQFKTVSENLEPLKALYPFEPELSMDPIGLDARSEPAVKSLKLAREAEKTGLDLIVRIVKHLSDD